jgi:elongation factor P--(R)-beta-lysine ligase
VCAAPLDWRPSASLLAIRRRAGLLSDLRQYFAREGVLEVDTPVLARHGTTDPALASFTVPDSAGTRYLQTSPESAMKRLLVAGSGDIFQIAHAFRREEGSRLHQEEFSLLEWYRVGFDHHQLMADVCALLRAVGFTLPIEKHSYAELCQQYASLDPHGVSSAELASFAATHGAVLAAPSKADRALLLDWVFGCVVLPQLPRDRALLIYDFPREHAAYARLRPGPPAVAERFELVVGEIELANGFHEVTDSAEQRARQQYENARRTSLGLPQVPLDEPLLAALGAGLPKCAGVALGLDRLLMLLLEASNIATVVAFAN